MALIIGNVFVLLGLFSLSQLGNSSPISIPLEETDHSLWIYHVVSVVAVLISLIAVLAFCAGEEDNAPSNRRKPAAPVPHRPPPQQALSRQDNDLYEEQPREQGVKQSYSMANLPPSQPPSSHAHAHNTIQPDRFFQRTVVNGQANFEAISLQQAEVLMNQGHQVFRQAYHPDSHLESNSEGLYEALPNPQALYASVTKNSTLSQPPADVYAMPFKAKAPASGSNSTDDDRTYGNINNNPAMNNQAMSDRTYGNIPAPPKREQNGPEPTYVPLEDQSQQPPRQLYQAVTESHYTVQHPQFVTADSDERLEPFEEERVCAWLAAPLSRNDAEAALKKDGTPGCYLVRRSPSAPDSFVLSLFDGQGVTHYKIINQNAKLMIHDEKNPPRPFNSLVELIMYYKVHDFTKPGGLPCQLGVCLTSPR